MQLADVLIIGIANYASNTELQKYKYFSALATPALNYFTVSKLKSNFKSRSVLGGAAFCCHLVIKSYIRFFICKRATPCREERARPDPTRIPT